MPTVKKDIWVDAQPEKIWSRLISDPNRWDHWLTPIRGYEERVTGEVAKGLEFHVQIGKIGGAKIKVVEAVPARRLRWNAGPAMAHMMRMPMRGTLELEPQGQRTHATLKMKTPMMMVPMMKMLSGINAKREMEDSISRIKSESEMQTA